MPEQNCHKSTRPAHSATQHAALEKIGRGSRQSALRDGVLHLSCTKPVRVHLFQKRSRDRVSRCRSNYRIIPAAWAQCGPSSISPLLDCIWREYGHTAETTTQCAAFHVRSIVKAMLMCANVILIRPDDIKTKALHNGDSTTCCMTGIPEHSGNWVETSEMPTIRKQRDFRYNCAIGSPFTALLASQIPSHIAGQPQAFFVPRRTRVHLQAATSWLAPAR